MDPSFTITSVDPDLSVEGIFGADSPTLSGGAGGWAETDRAKRKAFTEWQGNDPRQMVVSMMFDGHADDDSVEPECAILHRLGESEGDFKQTPVVMVEGAAIPPLALDIEWVISGIAWGAVIRDGSGVRTRQEVSITFLEYVEADVLFVKKNTLGTVPPWRLYKVRKSDTFPIIAARLYKKASRWREIAKLNNMRGPMILPRYVGKKIKVPRR